jgi:predicted transcriptional regulator
MVWKSRKADRNARISFVTPELLWKGLIAKRWELIKAMACQGPMTLREAARRVGRDVKAVHSDTHALLAAGILRKTLDEKLEFRSTQCTWIFCCAGLAWTCRTRDLLGRIWAERALNA